MFLTLKIILFICLTSPSCTIMVAQQGQPFSITINCAQPPITLNNIMDSQPHTTIAPIQTTKQSVMQESEQTTAVIQEKPYSYKHINNLAQSIWQYCLNKKYSIIGGVLVLSIASFCYYYYQMKRYLADEKNWSTWHNGSLQALLESTNQSITDMLLNEMQIRYYNKVNPTNPIGPLIMFSITIDEEIKYIKQYISVLSFGKRIYFYYIFSIEKDMQDAQKKLDFVIFLKRQFLEWISHYNLKSLNSKEVH